MDRRPVDADVVVVGGGPAGSAAAIACATRGLSVVMCEREPPGRDRPGETLHPGIEPLLQQLGIADRLAYAVSARHPGAALRAAATAASTSATEARRTSEVTCPVAG